MYSILQQVEYAGLIERVTSEDQDSDKENGVDLELDKEVSLSVEYGITSLVDKKTVLQPGDKVCRSQFLEEKSEELLNLNTVMNYEQGAIYFFCQQKQ